MILVGLVLKNTPSNLFPLGFLRINFSAPERQRWKVAQIANRLDQLWNN